MMWESILKKKNLIHVIALLFVVNRSATFCEADSSMLMRRVIKQIILSLLYTIMIYLIKMHRTTSSSDVCDVENMITSQCAQKRPKTPSFLSFLILASGLSNSVSLHISSRSRRHPFALNATFNMSVGSCLAANSTVFKVNQAGAVVQR